MRQHGAQVSRPNNFKREQVYGSTENLRGEKGEPSQVVTTTDTRTGGSVTIDHHSNGHQFKDTGTHEKPHYHGKDGSHLSYDKKRGQ